MSMETCCLEPNHSKRPIILICTNPDCHNKPFLCSKCIISHRGCLDFLLDVQEEANIDLKLIEDKNKANNMNKSNCHPFDKLGLITDKKELFEAYEELIDYEFKKLAKYFTKKIRETKQGILKKAQDIYSNPDYDFKDFKKRIKKLYNFSSLPEVIESLQGSQADVRTITKGFENFLDDFDIKKTQKKSYQQKSQLLENSDENGFVDNLEEIIQLKTLPQKIKEVPCEKTWCWDPFRKSLSIELRQSNTIAEKKKGAPNCDTAVLGSVEISEGYYEWELQVFDQWICFGIIERKLIRNLEDFPYYKSIGLNTGKKIYQMEKVNTLNDYKNKTYKCSLNMNSGTFMISFQGMIIAKQQQCLKGKIFVPFVDIYNAGGRVKLISSIRHDLFEGVYGI